MVLFFNIIKSIYYKPLILFNFLSNFIKTLIEY